MRGKIPYIGKSVKQKHLDRIKAEILQGNEQLHGAFYGQTVVAPDRKGRERFKYLILVPDYLLLTSERIVLWSRGVLFEGIETFHYRDIIGVEEKNELFVGGIILKTAAGAQKITSIPKGDISIATRMIREKVAASNG